MRRAIASVIVAATLSVVSRAHADETERLGAITVHGRDRSSSTGSAPRTPLYELENPSDEARTVTLRALETVDGEGHSLGALPIEAVYLGERELRATGGEVTFTIAPHETLELRVAHGGERQAAGGGGLPFYRYRLALASGSSTVRVIAVTSAMCRMPLRR